MAYSFVYDADNRMGHGGLGDPPGWSQMDMRQEGRVGIYGWRKRCLYAFILLLLITVIVNLALTVWILRVLDFNLHGMGNLRIIDNGVYVDGDAHFLKTLYAGQIKANQNSALYLESSKNITINVRDSDGVITEQLYLGGHKVISYAREFEVRSSTGDLLFFANSDQVELGGQKSLSISDSGGAVFSGSVQTPLVSTDTDHLRLESLTRQLLLFAPKGVNIASHSGSVSLTGRNDVTIKSRKNAIRLDAHAIELKNLVTSKKLSDRRSQSCLEVYQVCVCGTNGRLYIAPSGANCTASSNICGS